MKGEKISIKWKIFLYFLIFTGLLLMILWFFQTVYLEVFYKNIKVHELENAMNLLKAETNEKNMEELVKTIAERYDLNIMITDVNGEVRYEYGRIPLFDFSMWYQKAKENNGSYFFEQSIEYEDKKEPPKWEMKQDFENHIKDEPVKWFPKFNMEERVTWVEILDRFDRENVYIIYSIITPVNATIHTLRIQLMFISGLLVILSLVIAFLLSKNISNSIIKVNGAAKELARGNYEITFEAKDYREIAELSGTLNYAAIELAKTEKFQRELLANVSHDLRTPLTMIIAYAEIMRDLPGENTPENIQVIIDESKRLTALVNDMLDISKLQAGVMTLEMNEYDLTENICMVLNRFSKLTEQNGYQIEFQFQEHTMVIADEYKINQVIYNLINNAINYTGKDKRVIVKQSIKKDMVRIEVEDTGDGIGEDVLPYVWDRYYKVDKNHKRAVSGSGLGLSIVRGILKLHGTEYGVESKIGRGSVFWFELKRKNF